MSYSETILLAVTGMSPAVLTETVWALSCETDPVIPHRVIAVTTSAGRDRMAADLFSPRKDWNGSCVWDELRERIAASGLDVAGKLRFGTTPDDMRVITAVRSESARSVELADLRNREDNEAAADFLLDQVRTVTANPDTRLIASIAGGRKTMGALLYACMTLAGREEDRLTHVLVNEPYDTLPSFFFPGQPSSPIDRDGGIGDNQPVVELADVPFVPIRNLFHRELGRDAGTFSRLVGACRSEVRHRAAEDLRIELFCHRPALRVNSVELRLGEREHHLLLCLAGRAKHQAAPVPSYGMALDVLAAHAREWDFLIHSGKLKPGTPLAPTFADEHDITRTLSDLRRKLKAVSPSGMVLAELLPTRGRFSMDVPGSLIAIL